MKKYFDKHGKQVLPGMAIRFCKYGTERKVYGFDASMKDTNKQDKWVDIGISPARAVPPKGRPIYSYYPLDRWQPNEYEIVG